MNRLRDNTERSPGAGRAVLITGCSSGIGRAAAGGLRRRGYRVFASARKAADVRALAADGFESLQLDVANSASIEAAAVQVLELTGGRLFGLFNNAGFGLPGAVEDLDRAALREQFEVNLFGAHELTRALIPAMRRNGGGRIVQNSSVLGLVALKYRGAYVASKFALEGLSDTLRLELDGSGVFVSLIEPGPIRSRFRANALAAFVRHVDPSLSVHGPVYAAVERRLRATDAVVPFTLGPEAVVKKLIHALESRRPKVRYYVTAPTYGFAAMRRLLPGAWLDRVLRFASGAENRPGPVHAKAE